MADEPGFTLSESAVRRTAQAVRQVIDGGHIEPLGAPEGINRRTGRYLVKAASYIRRGQSGNVTIYHGTTAGSETTTSRVVSAYARYTSIVAGEWAEAYEMDGRLIVEQPRTEVLGQSATAINKGASGTVNILSGATPGSESATGETKSCYNRWGNIPSGKTVYIALEENGWAIIRADVC